MYHSAEILITDSTERDGKSKKIEPESAKQKLIKNASV